MTRTSAALGSLGWLLLAPGTVCGLVPLLITGWDRPGDQAAWLDVLGWSLVLPGAAVLGHAFVAFAWHGRGTPAPSAPTEQLVVEGAYRFVRNPMYLAVFALLLGQALLFASGGLLVYLVVVGITTDVFVRGYEEPTLRETFGPAYEEFSAEVPRWMPRRTPWRGASRVTPRGAAGRRRGGPAGAAEHG
ncbi:Isoprenylcysteine carboxyl methyltransferase [Modestobacter italicus]|uniref:Isoprenylcysteine carboxyl methyltransferase n=1 Tax=Modestobacter italicus (strain DSM 44449 / CECT 9708 / BC 501) TaxID=2732864 RepID=I4EV27_MODI5|nr:isoprenylcysteine carboxylmethyltransferase family protein [Modestobacter marinus]CCH87240.1 Isoprenylcysteine carboxyl methyltransferase [Modestobacter marinus]